MTTIVNDVNSVHYECVNVIMLMSISSNILTANGEVNIDYILRLKFEKKKKTKEQKMNIRQIFI